MGTGKLGDLNLNRQQRVYMGMQAVARRPSTKLAFLPPPKHSRPWYYVGPGWPGPMHQAMLGPLPRHVG